MEKQDFILGFTINNLCLSGNICRNHIRQRITANNAEDVFKYFKNNWLDTFCLFNQLVSSSIFISPCTGTDRNRKVSALI
jgi:hypothetical protein